MAKYCDHGLYAVTGATPTWGQAQEGDGAAIGAATSAIVSIDLSAATAAAGATISVMGAVLTCVASGATTNQFNAGSGATLVSNLVTAINRTTNTSTVAAQATGWTTPKIQDAVFARIGTPTTTLQIMTRAGSAQYNSSQVVTSGLTGGTFGPYTFSGGASGAWGALANTAAVFGSSIAVATYGIWGATLPIAGAVEAGDKTKVRSGKLLSFSVAATLLSAAMGTAAEPVEFEIDNNTTWADGDNQIVELRLTGSSSVFITFAPSNTTYARLAAQITADGSRNLLLNSQNTSASSGVAIQVGGPSVIENVYLKCATTGSASITSASSMTSRTRVVNPKFESPYSGAFLGITSSGGTSVDLIQPVFSNLGAVIPHPGILVVASSATNHIVIESPIFENFVSGTSLVGSSAQTGKLSLRNPTLGNVTVLGGKYLSASLVTSSEWSSPFLSITSQKESRDFLLESRRGLYEWNSGRSYPTLSAVLPNGSPYSVRALPTTQAANVSRNLFFESPRFGKRNTLATAQRTIKLHFALEQNLAWTRNDIELLVVYTDANGNLTTISSTDYNATALTADSGSTWSVQSNGSDGGTAGQVKFDDLGLLFFNKYKLEITTPSGKNMKGSNVDGEYYEVGVYVRINTPVADTSKFLFICPDFEIV